MKVSREQARDVRSGRAWSMRVGALPMSPGPSPATRYAALVTDLDGLRTAVAARRDQDRSGPELRHAYAALDRTLAHAIAQAFSADAHGVPTPRGIATWAAEGLARSYERELAMFAAMDVGGPVQLQRPGARP